MQTGKITALYVRFSFDDGIDTESGSIEHQKALLKNYAEYNGFTNLSYYADWCCIIKLDTIQRIKVR